MLLAPVALLILAGADCLMFPGLPDDSSGIYNNVTDKSNNGATYIGTAACRACHPSIFDTYAIHGHGHALKPINGQPPTYPPEGTRAGVPNPPDGYTWNDVSYVIGGYYRKARFLDLDGFFITTGEQNVDTQWNLLFPPNGSLPGFAPFQPDQASPLPFDFRDFRCMTTGPVSQDPDRPEFQDNRRGILGTWSEPGIQCEACHGPGSSHPSNPAARDLFVDPTSAQTCYQCHSRPFESQTGEIIAEDGFIKFQQQYPELRASGGHSMFSCTFCHAPHVSVTYDRQSAIRNECIACHAEQNMALHEGKVFTRGDYTEVLTCQSCHMTFATRNATAAGPAVVGDEGRMGDTRTHIFRINAERVGFEAMFTPDGRSVVTDSEGRAAVTVDFVCLRCHNGIGAFDIDLENAADIALFMHGTTMTSRSAFGRLP